MVAADEVTKFTSADLALMPDDGKRREIIEGELYVSSGSVWKDSMAAETKPAISSSRPT